MEVFQLYKFLWVGSAVWITMECFMSGEPLLLPMLPPSCRSKIKEVEPVPLREQNIVTDSTSNKFE